MDLENKLDEMSKPSLSEPETSTRSQAVDVSSDRPEIPKLRSFTPISGRFSSSTHGGFVTPFGYAEYLAGAKLDKLTIQGAGITELLKHITLARFQLNVLVGFVPNTAVFPSADKFSSQREDPYGETPISLPTITNPTERLASIAGQDVGSYSTNMWRETIACHYFGVPSQLTYNACLPRGYVKLVNDVLSDKRSQPPLLEYFTDVPTADERRTFFSFGITAAGRVTENMRNDGLPIFLQRAPASKNYLNDYRLNVMSDNSPVDNTSRHTHNVTQREIDEFRQRSSNINKTDAQIIAEIRGTGMSRDNDVQIIGRKILHINTIINDQASQTSELPLGSSGAISYTEFKDNGGSFDIDLKGFTHPKDGYLHFLYVLSMPDNTIYTRCENYEAFRTSADDLYRPALKELKDVPLYAREIHGGLYSGEDKIIGYRRYGSHYYRLPNMIRGDFMTDIVDNNNPSIPRRSNTQGFISASLDGSSVVRLPSKVDWTSYRLLGEQPDIVNIGVDTTDITLRRLMYLDGGNLSSRLYRRRTNHCFFMDGEYTLYIQQPIDPKIQRDIIGWGVE